MRRLTVLILALILLLPAARAEELPYPRDTVLSVLELTGTQQALTAYLYPFILQGTTRIDLPRGTLYDDAAAAVRSLTQDYPELFHLEKMYSIGYYQDEPEYAVWLQLRYTVPAEEADSMRRSMLNAAQQLLSDGPAPDLIHDRLCEGVVYNHGAPYCSTAYGALMEGEASCEGYAQALTLLFRMSGIPCGMITGTAVDAWGYPEAHSWNIARLQGCTLIDATWNDQSHLGLNTHWYYGLSTDQMGADHFPDAGQRIPDCGEQDNWHARRSLIISSQAQADAAIGVLIREGSVSLRITDAALYAAIAHDTAAFLEDYNQRHPQEPFLGAYSIIHSDPQQCLVLQRAE